MNRIINPTDIMAPLNNVYSHGMVIPAGARVLHTAGQVGARPNGVVSPRIEDQAEQLWENLLAIVRDADMEVSDIVKLTAYVVGVENYAAYATARASFGSSQTGVNGGVRAAVVKTRVAHRSGIDRRTPVNVALPTL